MLASGAAAELFRCSVVLCRVLGEQNWSFYSWEDLPSTVSVHGGLVASLFVFPH